MSKLSVLNTKGEKVSDITLSKESGKYKMMLYYMMQLLYQEIH